jgi:Flp pilus assembly protein TadG
LKHIVSIVSAWYRRKLRLGSRSRNDKCNGPFNHKMCALRAGLQHNLRYTSILNGLWPHDRRGATAITFAVTATALIGFAAIATEAGGWYLTRRSAQNAADAGARAGALALVLGPAAGRAAQITASAADLAGQNGFTADGATTLTVNNPPVVGAHVGDGSAVEVTISQRQPVRFTALFMAGPATITTRAVAKAEDGNRACILGLTGGLLMGGNSVTSGPGCVLASNADKTDSISIYGSAEVTAYSLLAVGGRRSAVGGCAGCASSGVHLTKPYTEYQLPLSNPYAALDGKTYSPSCRAAPSKNATSISPTGLSQAYCSSIELEGNNTLDFAPGTYLFKNASVNIQSGTVTCADCIGGAGVTVVFMGDPAAIGGIKINANAVVTLRAPTANPDDPDFDGVLFFRDPRATTNNTGNPSVRINGGSDTYLFGAMYFPTSYVKFNGNTDMTPSTCTELIGGTVDFTGTANTYVDITGCDVGGTRVPRGQIVRLVE